MAGMEKDDTFKFFNLKNDQKYSESFVIFVLEFKVWNN